MSDREPTGRASGDPGELGEMLGPLRGYHEPGETPREEMWTAIVARIRSEAVVPGLLAEPLAGEPAAGDPSAGEPRSGESWAVEARVRPIERARRKLARPMPWLGWAAAASVVLLIGVAVGRSTAPDASAPDGPGASAAGSVTAGPGSGAGAPTAGLDAAVRRHFGRSESLLTVVRSDGRQGLVDPAAAAWAGDLLTQTRLLLDARAGGDPALVALLQDLELVLAEIVMVSQAGTLDAERTATELDLVLRALELSSVLPRMQAACPRGCATNL